MQASHRVIVNTGILYARMGFTVILSLYTTRLILASLGEGDFGTFNLVGGAIAMLVFLNAGMAAATARFLSYAHGAQDEDRLRRIFNVSMVLHAGIALILLAILEGAGWVLFRTTFQIEPERLHAAQLVYQFAVVSTILTVISVPYEALINAHEHMLVFAILGIIEAVLKLFIALHISLLESDRLISYGLWSAILSVLLIFLRAGYCHYKYSECTLNPIRHFEKNLFNQMKSFAGWSFLGSSTSLISNYGQGIVLNLFFGTAVNAAQGVANQVSGQLGTFAGTMLRALSPQITKSEGAGDRELMLRTSVMGSKIGFFLLMIFYVPVIIEMPYIFGLWLESVPAFAVIFCQLLLIRNLIEQLFITLSASIAAVGNIRSYQIVSAILTALPLIISYLLFTFGFPPYVLYIVFIVYSILTSAVILYFAQRVCGLPPTLFLSNVVARCSSAFLITFTFAAVPLLFMPTEFTRFAIVTAIAFLAYIPIIGWIGFTPSERHDLGRILTSLVNAFRNKIHPFIHSTR